MSEEPGGATAMRIQALLIGCLVLTAGCGDDEPAVPEMRVVSPAFSEGATIPADYTGGAGVSPPLFFYDVPAETESLAIIVDDPDAPVGRVVHWVVWGLSNRTGVPENLSGEPTEGVVQGVNATGKVGYFPPNPPTGEEHRYFFEVYALDHRPALEEGATEERLVGAMDGHILARGETYGLSAN
jgi:Raf kinase inhibitor-like YbhB/YbcL family protein